MKKTIPAVTITCCDRCGKQFDRELYQYHLTGHMMAVSFQGDTGGGNVAFDFCADCSLAFDDFIKEGKVKSNA